jgi:cell division topological specificity factor
MGFFDSVFGRRGGNRGTNRVSDTGAPPSAQVAKQRLVDVLAQDHVKLTPEAMAAIRADFLRIVSRHIDVEADQIQIDITRSERGERLVANVPVRRGGGRRR